MSGPRGGSGPWPPIRPMPSTRSGQSARSRCSSPAAPADGFLFVPRAIAGNAEPMAQSAGLHEPAESLTPDVIDRHRAITSLQEELEAVDWYDQRVAAAADDSLAAVLAHNRDEEKEHAAMTLEWLRRRDPVFDTVLRTYLFTA